MKKKRKGSSKKTNGKKRLKKRISNCEKALGRVQTSIQKIEDSQKDNTKQENEKPDKWLFLLLTVLIIGSLVVYILVFSHISKSNDLLDIRILVGADIIGAVIFYGLLFIINKVSDAKKKNKKEPILPILRDEILKVIKEEKYRLLFLSSVNFVFWYLLALSPLIDVAINPFFLYISVSLSFVAMGLLLAVDNMIEFTKSHDIVELAAIFYAPIFIFLCGRKIYLENLNYQSLEKIWNCSEYIMILNDENTNEYTIKLIDAWINGAAVGVALSQVPWKEKWKDIIKVFILLFIIIIIFVSGAHS